MPISIYQIENLFWSNETYEFPAHLPTIFVDQKEDLALRPEMDGYYTGTIRLEGANWNWCKFEGIYYHLKRTTCLDANPDPKKEVWLYSLVRCMWTNTVLTNTIEVKGDLATWNIDSLLQNEINKCAWMVEKPVEIFRTPFIDEDPEQWRWTLVQNSEEFKPITWEPREKVLTRKTFASIKDKIKALKGFQEATKYLYFARKDIYIFGLIEGTVYKDGWKAKAIRKINKAHRNIRYDDTRKLVKVTTPQNHNKLLNHYALSYSESSIGTVDNSMVLKTLNLSQVKDIVPVDWKDLKEKTKEVFINEETAIFDLQNDFSSVIGWDKPWKLARRFYAPLGDPKHGYHYFYGKYRLDDWTVASRNVRSWREAIRGQKIKYRSFGDPSDYETGYFYWVDKVDFALNWYDKWIYGIGLASRVTYSIAAWPENIKNLKKRKGGRGDFDLQAEPLWQYINTIFYSDNDGYSFSNRRLPVYPVRDADTKDTIWHRMSRPPSYGVLIWQTERNWNDWDRVKYLGKNPLKKLYWYSGIHWEEFKKSYERSGEWWSDINGHTLAGLCANTYFSKFFLDLDFLLWVYFTPKVCCSEGTSWYQYPYFYFDNYDLNNILDGGIGDYDGIKIASGVRKIINRANNTIIKPPFTDSEYPSYSWERGEKIRRVLLRSEIDLKEEFDKDYTIESGDFFCSDLEYEWREWRNDIWNSEPGYYTGMKPDVITRSLNLLEDFIWTSLFFKRGTKLEHEEALKDGEAVCLCSNLEGGIEIRRINWFKKEHSLSRADYQAVQSVDGETSKTITYWLLKGLGIDLSTEIGYEIDRSATNKLLAYFYKALGYDVQIEKRGKDFVAKWNWITDEMMNSPEGVLLDLVGSDWYAYLRNQDEVHFIYKHADPSKKDDIISREVKRSTLDRSQIDERLKKASLTAKINQINILYFFNTPIHLKTKFLFSDIGVKDSPFYVQYKGFNTKDRSVNEDFWFFKAKGEWDEIDEVISVPKEPVNITQVADQLNLAQLRLSQNFEQERYENQQQFLGLDQKLIDIKAERAKFDLNTEDINKSIGFAFDMAGLVGSMAMRSISPVADAVMSSIDSTEFDLGKKPFSLAAAYKTQPGSHIATWQTAKGIKGVGRFLRKAGLGPTMGLIQGGAKIASYAMWKNRILPEKSRRIQEDKELATKQIALRTLEMDRSHFQAMQDYALRMNYLANQHFKEGFNEAALYEEWKKEKKIDSKVYLLTLIPSEKQLKYIEEYREHYGVQCDIPNKVITLKSGMAPNVIRFRNLDEGAILGISDLVARAWLKARLLCQVKIIDNERPKQEYSYFDYHVVTPVLVSDLEAHRKIEELEEALKKAQDDLTHSHKANQLNLNAFLNKLDQDRQDETKLQGDIDALNEIKKKVQDAIAKWEEDKKTNPDLEKPYEDSDLELVNKFIKVSQDFLENWRSQKTLRDAKDKAEDERDKAREELNNAHNKERSLLNENQALQTNLKNTREQLEHEKADKLEKEEQLDKKTKELDEKTKTLAAKQAEAEKATNELNKTKQELSQAKSDLAKCRATNFDVSTAVSKTIRGWSYCDFLKTFYELGWNYDALYKLLVKTPLYGLQQMEFYGCDGVPTLQAIQQTVEECEKLLDDDWSFLPQDNKALREYLLTTEGADQILGMKRKFIDIWKDIWFGHITEQEEMSFGKLKQSKSIFYDKTLQKLNFQNENVLKENTNYYFGSKIGINNWVWKNAFWEDNYSKWEVYCYSLSFRWFTRWFVTRYVPDTSTRVIWYSWNESVYNSYGYYDIYNRSATLFPMLNKVADIIRISHNWISVEKKHVFRIGKKCPNPSSHDGDWLIGWSNAYLKWKYSGRSDRQYLLGYFLTLTGFIHENVWNKEMTKHDFHIASTSCSPGTIYFMKKWLTKLGMTMQEWNETVLYQLKIAREVLCNSKSWEEAQDIVEEELADMYASEDPSEGALREKKIKEEYPGRS